jgi:hypothetical protein
MDKLTANTVHALKRAQQRYGACLNKTDLDAMLSQIASGTKVKRHHSNGDTLRRKVWDVEYSGVLYRVVVEDNKKANRRCIVTFLPL